MLETNFSIVDWIIVGVYLAGTVGIGLWVNRYIASMSDFLVAGRTLKTRVAVATMIGSELGLVTAMYSAQKGFTGGFAAFHIGLIAGVMTLMVGLTGFIVVPLRRMGVMTIPEFYYKRFDSRGLRIFGGLLLAVSGILNMGMFLKAGAIFVTGLTGMTDPMAVKIVMTVMILLVLTYTTLGGMIAVVITDYIQFVVLSIGLLIAVILAVVHLGWSDIVETVGTVHGTAGFDPLNDAGFGPSYVTWMFFIGVVACSVWQTAVMRACAAESVEVVRRLYIWSSIGFMIRFIIPQFLGICALVYLFNHPEAKAMFFSDGAIIPEKSMQAMPIFLSQLLPVGLIGLVGAGMLAAFMSTHDTYLLCWASVITEDVINPGVGHRLSTQQRLTITRILLFLIAAFLLVWSMWYELGQDLWDYMAVTGAIYFTGAFAVLACGIYFKRASVVGAYLALLTGLGSVLGLGPVQAGLGIKELLVEHGIGSAHIGLGCVLLAVVMMFVGSMLFPDKKKEESS